MWSGIKSPLGQSGSALPAVSPSQTPAHPQPTPWQGSERNRGGLDIVQALLSKSVISSLVTNIQHGNAQAAIKTNICSPTTPSTELNPNFCLYYLHPSLTFIAPTCHCGAWLFREKSMKKLGKLVTCLYQKFLLPFLPGWDSTNHCKPETSIGQALWKVSQSVKTKCDFLYLQRYQWVEIVLDLSWQLLSKEDDYKSP